MEPEIYRVGWQLSNGSINYTLPVVYEWNKPSPEYLLKIAPPSTAVRKWVEKAAITWIEESA